MNLPSRSKSSTILVALFAGAAAMAGLSGWGCTDSSGGGISLGAGGMAAGGQSGAAGGAAGAAGGAAGAAGGTAGGDAGGAGGSAGGAGGSKGSPVGGCVATAASTSGIDPSTRLDALTLAQKAAYCDWAASRYCGYGQLVDCGDGNYLGVYSQADCVANMDNTVCASTVGENEACEKQTTCSDTFPEICLAVSMCQ